LARDGLESGPGRAVRTAPREHRQARDIVEYVLPRFRTQPLVAGLLKKGLSDTANFRRDGAPPGDDAIKQALGRALLALDSLSK